MSPKNDNQIPKDMPDVTVNIPHEQKPTPLTPVTAPPLPELEPLPVRPINITDNVPTPPPAIPVAPPELSQEFHEREGRHWPVILMYTALALLVAVTVVFTGRWIYQKTTYQTTKTVKPETSDRNKLPALPPNDNQQPSSGGATSSPASGASQNQSASQLPNNGPGDVAAIFAGTVLAVGGLHYIYTLRREH